MCCTCRFHARQVMSSSLVERGPGEYGLDKFVKSQTKICQFIQEQTITYFALILACQSRILPLIYTYLAIASSGREQILLERIEIETTHRTSMVTGAE